ncbi:MAG TPA: mechanosensitive ion channel family protein [Bacteroidales bacterium]|nr:mechanosensitive ion channel family protein [Bacteroidales bacterium]
MPTSFNISPELISNLKQIVFTLIAGYLIIQALIILARRVFFRNVSKQSKMLITKGIIYIGIILILFIIISILDLKKVFQTMLGAAGVLGIVLGIASQTSIGNIISGLFLISEKPFEIGDLIRVGDKLGNVYSIDLLSIKLRTLDNLLIRIPNQTIISTEVTNITKFPIRRMDIMIGVAYKEDLKKVAEVLKSIAMENPLCLDEPEPLIVTKTFNTSSIDFQFGVWFEKTNYAAVRNSIFQQITERFREENIEIPFPHISVYTGEETKPFLIQQNENEH